MTTPTPEQQPAETAEVIDTAAQPLRHVNSVFADETCAEEDGLHHLAHRGGFVVAEGWDD